MDQIFHQNLYCWFFSEHLGHAWLNPNKITWSDSNFHEHLSLHSKKELYTSNNFCDIKTYKILQSDWPRAFLYITRERFSQNMRFLQNHTDNYSGLCKPKNSTSESFPYWRVPPPAKNLPIRPPPRLMRPTGENLPHPHHLPLFEKSCINGTNFFANSKKPYL